MAGVENSSSWNDFAALAVQMGHQAPPAQATATTATTATAATAAPIEKIPSYLPSNHSIHDGYEDIPAQHQPRESLNTTDIDNDDYLIAMQLANSQSIRSIQSVEPPLPPARTRPQLVKTDYNDHDDMLAALEYAQDPPSSPDSPSAVPSVPVTTTAPPPKTQQAFFPSSFTSSKAAVERAKLARERREKALRNPGKPRKPSKKRKNFGGRTSNLHDAWAPSSDDDAEITSEEEEDDDDDEQSAIVPLKTRIQRAKEAEQLAHQKQKQEEEEAARVNSFGIPNDLLNEKASQEFDSSPNQHTSTEEEHRLQDQLQADDLDRAFARQSLTPASGRPSIHNRQSTATTVTLGERERRRQSAEMHLLANQQRQQSMMMAPQIKHQQQQQLQNQRQSMWTNHLEHPNNMDHSNNYEKFINIEPEMEQKNPNNKFAPFGLLQAGMMNKQSKTAKAQEQYARDYGVGMVLPPAKVPEPQFGLLGQIAAHEKDRKRVGGLGALLTERDREKRGVESSQRKYNEAVNQQSPSSTPYNMPPQQGPPQMPMQMDPRMSMMMNTPMMMNNMMMPPQSPQYYDPAMSMMAMNAMQQQQQQQQLMMQGMYQAQQAYNATLYQYQQSNPGGYMSPSPHAYPSDGAGLGVGFNQTSGRMSTGPYMNNNHSSSRPRSTFFSDAK
ncbi:hypothetical protein E3P77_01904 [Wallemia ichthyophaga]|nr:hypothetical protein E3P97_00972 [Wallemia ichthyophaga]TIB29601.1 hypothetical protein E3P85_03084 [Wallemia ichthyophaga]TIB49036.1 hypothetical protein E3P82_00969 [Wallemia ichthyophaga]TIB53000.1 hypothetical protein E3P81_00971 [Wallemia ichthyophaga]TIB55632.1 hypothetical protein E3P80_00970 [Wallemia ichthyophaga]